MMRRRSVRIVLSIFLVLFVGYFGLRYYIFYRIEKAIDSQLDHLRDQGWDVQVGSIETNFLNSGLAIRELEISKDSLATLSFSLLEVNGISLTPLLINHEVKIDAINCRQPFIQTSNNFKLPSKGKREGAIQVGRIVIDSAVLELMDSSSYRKLVSVRLNVDLNSIHLEKAKDSISSWTMGDAMMTEMNAESFEYFYKLRVKRIVYSSIDKTLTGDSITLNPTYGRNEFAQRSGKQIDQLTCRIPELRLTRIDLAKPKGGIVSAGQASLSLHLEAFRDKRIPRKERKPTVLPMKFLSELKFGLTVDSVIINDSYISYEEISEEGIEPGVIFFDGFHARISNISSKSLAHSKLDVKTRFMNAGNMVAQFTFPEDPMGSYHATGSLSDFSMPALNRMLAPVAHAEIESGQMKMMKFNFVYNEYRSDGEIELTYHDLKVKSLKKNPQKSINKFMSFIANLLVSKNLDRSDTRDKRTGTIQYFRNPQRGIFNYWWNSVFSGVKSVYGIDKFLETNGKKKAESGR